MSDYSERFDVPAVLQNGRRFLTVLLLGFASGLPLALTGGAMQAWLTVEGWILSRLVFLYWLRLLIRSRCCGRR